MSLYKRVTMRFILYITVPTLTFVLGVLLGSATTTEKYEKETKKEEIIDKFYVVNIDSCKECPPGQYNYWFGDSALLSSPLAVTLPTKKYEHDTFLLIKR